MVGWNDAHQAAAPTTTASAASASCETAQRRLGLRAGERRAGGHAGEDEAAPTARA